MIEDAYNSLRVALARGAKKERLAGKPTFGAPSERDYRVADMRIDSMSNTELLQALAIHENT